MSKGQKRSNREAKKPKQVKSEKKPPLSTLPLSAERARQRPSFWKTLAAGFR